MNQDGQQGGPTAEQTVAQLFEAAGYEVSQAVGIEPGTVNWFATPRSGLERTKTYFRVWERCPVALEPALSALEEARRASKADRALGVVMAGGLPAGYAANLVGRETNAITYRRLALEVSGIADNVRRSIKEYEESGGPQFYLPYQVRTASGEVMDAVASIKDWVRRWPAGDLVLDGSDYSSIRDQAMYEISVQFEANPEQCVPLVRSVDGMAADMAMAAGCAILVSDDFEKSRYEQGLLAFVRWYDFDGDPYGMSDFLFEPETMEILPIEPKIIEEWFRGRLKNDNIYEQLARARRVNPEFAALTGLPSNRGWFLDAMRSSPISVGSTDEWIVRVVAQCMAIVIPSCPASSEFAPSSLEQLALEQFALGTTRKKFKGRHRYLAVDPPRPPGEFWSWVEQNDSDSTQMNRFVRDYFLARRLAREINAGNTELLTRYQLPKEYVLLFLAILSPEAAAQITADKTEAMRAQIEIEVERRLQLTLAHQLNRSVGAVRLNVKNIQEGLSREDLERFQYEFGRIEEELSFQSALVEQTRRLHEVPNGTFESLGLREFIGMIVPPLQAKFSTVQCEILVDPMLRVRASRGSLREILHCLVENAFQAVAFAGPPDPRVRICATVEGETLRLDVLDNGAGIRAEDRERIFDRYVTTKKGGDQPLGTGLGLTIARRYAERIGGQVGLDSDREGTCFFARFVVWREVS